MRIRSRMAVLALTAAMIGGTVFVGSPASAETRTINCGTKPFTFYGSAPGSYATITSISCSTLTGPVVVYTIKGKVVDNSRNNSWTRLTVWVNGTAKNADAWDGSLSNKFTITGASPYSLTAVVASLPGSGPGF